jgi:hypothetical protein
MSKSFKFQVSVHTTKWGQVFLGLFYNKHYEQHQIKITKAKSVQTGMQHVSLYCLLNLSSLQLAKAPPGLTQQENKCKRGL